MQFVDENDPAVKAQFVEIAREGGSTRAYYAAPADSARTIATIVMTLHITGIDASLRDTARRFAKDGFATVVPDLYERFGAPNGDEVRDYRQFIPFAQQLTQASVDADLLPCAEWLRRQFPHARTAIAGFCMGGVMALRRTSGYSHLFSAAAVWYGSIVRANVAPEAVEIPIVASFGADDAGIPVNEVETFRANLTVPNDIVIYPNAGHAFFDYDGPTYEPTAAEDSYTRATTFLRHHLSS